MNSRSPFQPPPFCYSVILLLEHRWQTHFWKLMLSSPVAGLVTIISSKPIGSLLAGAALNLLSYTIRCKNNQITFLLLFFRLSQSPGRPGVIKHSQGSKDHMDGFMTGKLGGQGQDGRATGVPTLGLWAEILFQTTSHRWAILGQAWCKASRVTGKRYVLGVSTVHLCRCLVVSFVRRWGEGVPCLQDRCQVEQHLLASGRKE